MMLTIEQYIAQMKKKDKIDEFDFSQHVENMTKTMKYVMDYFNEYLDPEAFDYEKIKTEQTAQKIKQEVETKYPQSQDFICQYYIQYRSRVDRELKKWLKGYKYEALFYCQDDSELVAEEFRARAKMKGIDIDKYESELSVLAKEIKENEVDEPTISGCKYLDNVLIDWIKDTYREYRVNLRQFAEEVTFPYYEEYVDSIYNRETAEFFHINRYNHRYNNNPFRIEDIYKDNSHRPFINGRKGELEMLIMYVWLFEDVKDTDYWPEYVNLCISTGRVSVVKNINALLPVKTNGIDYPEDIKCTTVYFETTDGLIKTEPQGSYILRINYRKDNDLIWKDEGALKSILSNLHQTFTTYGPPYALELLSPIRTLTFNEEEFIAQYKLFEKGLKKYSGLKIVLVNGPQRNPAKPQYLMQNTEDILRIRKIAKEMKFRLKIAVDIFQLFKRKNYRSQFQDDFDKLGEIRKSIIGLHLSSIPRGTSIGYSEYEKEGKRYLNKLDHPPLSDTLACLSALFNDNQLRYLVPAGLDNPSKLEELVDDLLRGGFSFRDLEGLQ